MISYYFAPKNEKMFIHVPKDVIKNEFYGFEIQELLSSLSAKPTFNLSDENNSAKHIIWINNIKSISGVLKELEKFNVLNENIKIILINKEKNESEIQGFYTESILENDFYVSSLKYRNKIILDKKKQYEIIPIKSVLPTFLTRILRKINYSQLSNLISPEIASLSFGRVVIKTTLNRRIDIMASLSGLYLINKKYEKDEFNQKKQILKLNDNLKRTCISKLTNW